ncbi:MAG: lytic transglycosylase domain-containing protein [Brevefilum sp.]
MRRIIVVPAVFIGCLIVIWVGTVAAAKMPSQEIVAPTLTAIAKETESDEQGKTFSREVNNDNAINACSISAKFPQTIQQWCPLIEAASQDTGLPAAFIASVMMQESGGDADVLSSSGAVGLMQVMPRDGKSAEFMCINGPCFASRPTIEELKDPAFNIAYGSKMLADLYAKHGSYREALFKYGPMDMGYRYADIVLNIWNNHP